MRLEVNGEARELETGKTVADLLGDLGVNTNHVAVELNRELLPRAQHTSHALSEGDRLEVVTLVGGG